MSGRAEKRALRDLAVRRLAETGFSTHQLAEVLHVDSAAIDRARAEIVRTAPCQIADPLGARTRLTCPERESGGVQCEVLGPHEAHRISDHTVRHGIAGNGYACGDER